MHNLESTVQRREPRNAEEIADLEERVNAETAAPESSPDRVPVVGANVRRLLATDPSEGVQLLRAGKARRLTSHDGAFSSRALFPFDAPRRTEFYELRLKGHGFERASAHAAGTTENLVVASGRITLGVGREVFQLERGDAVLFAGDQEHTYDNPELEEAVLHAVMTYATSVGG